MSDQEKSAELLLIPVSRLLRNPFDKGPMDEELVKRKRVSLKVTGLKNIRFVGRPSKDMLSMWEVDDGKHTIKAISEEFGPKTKVEVLVSALTDGEILRGGLFKNLAQRTATDDELRQAVIEAEKDLLVHPEICPVRISLTQMRKENPLVETTNHKCPTQECISQFLQVLELSQQDISRLFSKWKPSKKDPEKKDEPDKQKDAATSKGDSSGSQSGKDDKKPKTVEELAAVSAEEEKREAEKKDAKRRADEARKAATRKAEAVLKDIATARIELGIGEDDSITEAIKAIRGGAIKSNQGGEAEMAAQARVLVLEEEMKKLADQVSYQARVIEQYKASQKRNNQLLARAKMVLPAEQLLQLTRDFPLTELGKDHELHWTEALLNVCLSSEPGV